MFEYQNQPGAPKPPRMSRVNWTQATTTTLAAAAGCLLAIGACVLLYRWMLGKAISAKQAELNALNNRIDDASYQLVRPKPVDTKPAPVRESSSMETSDVDTAGVNTSAETKTDSIPVKDDTESAEKEKTYVPPTMPGTPIETTKVA